MLCRGEIVPGSRAETYQQENLAVDQIQTSRAGCAAQRRCLIISRSKKKLSDIQSNVLLTWQVTWFVPFRHCKLFCTSCCIGKSFHEHYVFFSSDWHIQYAPRYRCYSVLHCSRLNMMIYCSLCPLRLETCTYSWRPKTDSLILLLPK